MPEPVPVPFKEYAGDREEVSTVAAPDTFLVHRDGDGQVVGLPAADLAAQLSDDLDASTAALVVDDGSATHSALSSQFVLLADGDRVDGQVPVWDADAGEWVSGSTGGGGGGGGMDSFTLAGDTGTQTITNGNTLSVLGGTNIDTVAAATDKVTVSLDSAATSALSAAGTALQPGAGLNALDSTAATKLGTIAEGAEVNVQSDWNAPSGDAHILNKPTLGTAAAANTGDFATATQGGKADSALQPNDGLNALDSTAATKLGGIEENADVTDATNVAAAGAVVPGGTAAVGRVPKVVSTGPTVVEWGDQAGGGGGEFASLSGSGAFMFSPFYAGNQNVLIGTSASSAHERIVFVPLPLPAGGTDVDALVIGIQTAGDSSSVGRLGLYASDGPDRLPGSLLVDAGTVAADSTGEKIATFTPEHVSGLVYLAFVWQQGVPTLQPTMYGAANVLWWGPVGTSSNTVFPFITQTSVSGALPSTASPNMANQSAATSAYLIRIGLRRVAPP